MAGTILLPAAILLAVACVAWIAALEMRSVATALRAFGLAVPSMSARVGYLATFASLATLVLPCCVSAILVHGDRAHGAALASVTLPAPDTTKAGSKACVMLAAAAACVLACLGLAAWAARQGEPLANVTLLYWHVHPSPLKLLACACISALVGAAAALLVDRLWQALVLSAVITLAVGTLASFVAYAWFGAPWGPWGMEQLFPDADEGVLRTLHDTLMPELAQAEAAAAALGSLVGIAGAASCVVLTRWRGLASRPVSQRWWAVGMGATAAVLGIMGSVALTGSTAQLAAQLVTARSAESGYRKVFHAPDLVVAVAIAGAPGQPLPEWLPEAQLERIRETSYVNAPRAFLDACHRILGLDPKDHLGDDTPFTRSAAAAFWARCRVPATGARSNVDTQSGSALLDHPWTFDQRLLLASSLPVAAVAVSVDEMRCQLLHEIAAATDARERLRLTGWVLPLIGSHSWVLSPSDARSVDWKDGIDPDLPSAERLRARTRARLASWLANLRSAPDPTRYISDSCARDAERVLAILETEKGDPFATSGASAP
ncbi:MAG: hypothetical protein U0636_11145 [Phycisphaerales bacterium]